MRRRGPPSQRNGGCSRPRHACAARPVRLQVFPSVIFVGTMVTCRQPYGVQSDLPRLDLWRPPTGKRLLWCKRAPSPHTCWLAPQRVGAPPDLVEQFQPTIHRPANFIASGRLVSALSSQCLRSFSSQRRRPDLGSTVPLVGCGQSRCLRFALAYPISEPPRAVGNALKLGGECVLMISHGKLSLVVVRHCLAHVLACSTSSSTSQYSSRRTNSPRGHRTMRARTRNHRDRPWRPDHP